MPNEITTFSDNDRKAVLALMKGMVSEDVFESITEADSVSELIGKPFLLKGAYLTTCEVTDEATGEVSKHPLLFLIADGHSIVSRSKSVISSVMTFFSFFGSPEEWSEPKMIEFKSRRNTKGHTFYNLKLVKQKGSK